jgi:hypothetical protein
LLRLGLSFRVCVALFVFWIFSFGLLAEDDNAGWTDRLIKIFQKVLMVVLSAKGGFLVTSRAFPEMN